MHHRPAMTSLKFATALLFLIGLQMPNARADVLWSNGATQTGFSSDTRCDSGPNTCGGLAPWTIFDNFSVPVSKPWSVTGFDFADFLVNGTNADYQSTAWSIWNGDPLSGGKLVASGTATAVPTLLSGTCGNGNTCLEEFTVTLGSPVMLAGGATYYLGTSNTISVVNNGETTTRAFAAGGNTAPGGTGTSSGHWDQSNGSTSGVVGSAWTAGTVNNHFPGDLGINEGATSFDIFGTVTTTAVPEPGTMSLLGAVLCAAGLIRRRIRP